MNLLHPNAKQIKIALAVLAAVLAALAKFGVVPAESATYVTHGAVLLAGMAGITITEPDAT